MMVVNGEMANVRGEGQGIKLGRKAQAETHKCSKPFLGLILLYDGERTYRIDTRRDI